MDTKNPYKPIENNLQSIQQESMAMEQSNGGPPPAYNNYLQQQPESNGSAPAAQPPAVNMQTNITTASGPQIIPISNIAFPQPVGPRSMEMNCPSCRCRIRTRVNHRSTTKTHIACLLLSWTCCLCCLPYCMDSCRNANHFCPMCGSFIGTYSS